MSALGPQAVESSSILESALHSFLSTAPEGVVRCRRSMQSPGKGSPAGHVAQSSPEKKAPRLQREEEAAAPGNQEDAEKTLALPLEVPPPQDTPATPHTPRPRTRDYFFANNGDVGSPWTILSPLTCSQGHAAQRPRQTHKHRIASLSGVDDLDDGVWESGAGRRVRQASPFVPEGQRAPVLRSVSVDEARQSPGAGFRLGDLFHRKVSQRSYSSGSRTGNVSEEDEAASMTGNPADGTFGFISFFRRIGGRSKTGDVGDVSVRGSST